LGVGGCPERLECDQTWHEVVAAEGPERIETGWWRRAAVRRDYWRVGLRDGRRWWIFYDLRARRWYLHGEFG
jgi:protein ImuB